MGLVQHVRAGWNPYTLPNQHKEVVKVCACQHLQTSLLSYYHN